MILPNFLVLGAHKAGTTSIYFYLKAHPDVFMPEIKEPRFFAYDDENPDHQSKVPHVFPITTVEEYASLFENSGDALAIGEASPEYLNSSFAANRIRAHIPDAKLIISLRNPIDRAYSLYQMSMRSKGASNLDPFKLTKENVIKGSYYPKLKAYFDNFSKEQIKVIVFEDLVRETSRNVADLFEFIGVNPGLVDIELKQHNQGGMPKSRFLYKLSKNRKINKYIKSYLPGFVHAKLNNLKNSNFTKAPALGYETRSKGIEMIKEDVHKVEELLDIDLSEWLRIKKS